MIPPRAIMGAVRGMARPRRPVGEREAVRAAAVELPALSARAAAGVIARRVAAAAMSDAEIDPTDAVALALAELAATVDGSPVTTLATCPEIDTMAVVRAHRLAAFEARGCSQLPEWQWPAERAAAMAMLIDALAARYARHLRKCA